MFLRARACQRGAFALAISFWPSFRYFPFWLIPIKYLGWHTLNIVGRDRKCHRFFLQGQINVITARRVLVVSRILCRNHVFLLYQKSGSRLPALSRRSVSQTFIRPRVIPTILWYINWYFENCTLAFRRWITWLQHDSYLKSRSRSQMQALQDKSHSPPHPPQARQTHEKGQVYRSNSHLPVLSLASSILEDSSETTSIPMPPTSWYLHTSLIFIKHKNSLYFCVWEWTEPYIWTDSHTYTVGCCSQANFSPKLTASKHTPTPC